MFVADASASTINFCKPAKIDWFLSGKSKIIIKQLVVDSISNRTTHSSKLTHAFLRRLHMNTYNIIRFLMGLLWPSVPGHTQTQSKAKEKQNGNHNPWTTCRRDQIDFPACVVCLCDYWKTIDVDIIVFGWAWAMMRLSMACPQYATMLCIHISTQRHAQWTEYSELGIRDVRLSQSISKWVFILW